MGTPDAGAFWRVCEQHGGNVLFTAPTTFRAIRKEDPRGQLVKEYNLTRLRTLFLAGERCDPDTLLWAEAVLGVPVIDHWWQTETGWPIAANCVGLGMLPVKPGSPTRAVPGFDVSVVDDDAQKTPTGHVGNVVIRLPLPPGCLPTLWNNDDGFVKSYLTASPDTTRRATPASSIPTGTSSSWAAPTDQARRRRGCPDQRVRQILRQEKAREARAKSGDR